MVGLSFCKTKTHLLLICACQILKWGGKRRYRCLVLFCAVTSGLCEGLLLQSGSCTSNDAGVCVDCVQKSNAMQHVPPASHFQDAFSLPHVNKYPESKFSFSEPNMCLFLQTFGKLSISLLVCIFILNLQMDRQLIVTLKLAMWKCKHKQ